MGWLGPRKSCLLFRISLAQLVRVWGTKRQNCQEIKTSNADHLKTQGNWVINKGAGISISYPVEFWDGEFACKGAITWRYKGFIMVMLNHAIILLISQLYYLYYNYITWRYKGSSCWDWTIQCASDISKPLSFPGATRASDIVTQRIMGKFQT